MLWLSYVVKHKNTPVHTAFGQKLQRGPPYTTKIMEKDLKA